MFGSFNYYSITYKNEKEKARVSILPACLVKMDILSGFF